MAAQRKMTFGIVVGNRGFFPGHLAKTGREEIIAVLQAAGAQPIVLSPEESRHGAVETYAESLRCAELFKKHAEEIDGIIVTLPNFGEERGIVDAIRLSGLKVPVLVQATPDRSDDMTIAVRRDSFCGKMSACNNMMQYGINYSLTTLHTESPSSPEFKADLEWFSQVCRIVKGLKNLKIGSIGARPAAFNTVRYSERILETAGISVEPIDLSEIFGRINRMKDSDDAAQAKLAAIKKYVTTAGIPEAALLKMAKLGAVVDGWKAYNIASDRTAGIGGWSDEALASYLSTGHADGHGGDRARQRPGIRQSIGGGQIGHRVGQGHIGAGDGGGPGATVGL